MYRIGAALSKDILNQEGTYKDREAQLAAIEKTFSDTKKPITKHHSKAGVYATEVMHVYPDFKVGVVVVIDVLCLLPRV